jgi:Flp pilus assembly protein TadG
MIRRLRSRDNIADRSDDGQILAAAVIFMFMFLAFLGFVSDGGRYLDACQAASTVAEQAARAGAAVLSPESLHSNTPTVSTAQAVSVAEQFMSTAGYPGTATVSNNVVHTSITYSLPTQILSITGINSLAVHAQAQSSNVAGSG